MGASNFARGNTTKVFAVLMNREETFKTLSVCENDCEGAELEEKTEYVSADEWEYDDLKSYIRDTAEEKAKELIYRYSNEDGSGNERQHNSNELFSYSDSKSFGDIEVEIKIVAKIVSAYYEGASLDFEVSIYNGGEWSELSDGYYKVTEEDVINDLFEIGYESYQSDMNKGMRLIQSKNAVKWAEKETERLKDLVEEIFTEVSMPLNVVATFSNGETVYSKV